MADVKGVACPLRYAGLYLRRPEYDEKKRRTEVRRFD